ncbi:SusC/RagA family TonB-linked outer membrane protein [Pedobacter sp. MC2016-14]|uniref:SusC/RagA family TonB-linked outer membrane protein n=1 Tax=Pedobacter sp. MC2016-14 TaxID=2897327 RepID=UPI001E517964|nr:SusC/RagA family TonB-linked outer membrane protein [Pedobacter sp. MC2016-14]MCD0488605.1 SusC/RagA family TonB-linked outer membrane protein [Pedobacter sp. MC2016-14]
MMRILPKVWLGSLLLTFACFFLGGAVLAQSQKISLNLKNVKRSAAVQALRKQSSFEFFYNEDELNKYPNVSIAVKEKPVAEVLDLILKGTTLKYSIEKNVVIISQPVTNSGAPVIKIRVTGKVSDANGQPVPGVNILEPQGRVAATSDANGNYAISVDKGAVIRFSFIGMKGVVYPVTTVGDAKLLTKNITLEDDNNQMNEVVVTGYQNIARRDLVGSIASVKAEDIKIAGTNQIDKLLQGQLAGVAVTNSSGLVGGKPRVRVRGTSTLLGNQEPVWVVDGIIQEDPIPFDYQQLNAFAAATASTASAASDAMKNLVGSTVAFLNVDDIDEITVLKDASSTAIYGVKAANGVIVITTKKGKAGKPSVNYSANFTTSVKPNYGQFNLMNSKERVDVSREIYARGLQFGVSPDPVSYEGLSADLFDKKITQEQFVAGVNKLETNNTDWFDVLFQTPFSQNHTISLSGGADKTTYYTSVGYMNDRGNTKGNEQKRYTAAVNINSNLTQNLRVGFKLNGSQSKTYGFYNVNPFNYAYNTSRTIPVLTDAGDPYFYVSPNTGSGSFRYNVLNEISQSGNQNKLNAVNAVANVDYKFLKDFNFQSLLGFGYTQTNAETFATERSNQITQKRLYEFGTALPGSVPYLASPIPLGGALNTINISNQTVTLRNTLNYVKRFRDHKDGFSVMVGQELRSSKYDGLNATTYGYLPDRGRSFLQLPLTTTNSGLTSNNGLYAEMVPSITDRLSNYLSYFATTTYNFNQKYVINANLRTDASNRFGQYSNHRFLPVWSIGGKWNIAEEGWFNKFSWLNQFSARISYGFQGNVAENFSPDLIAQIPGGAAAVNPISGDPALMIRSLAYKDLRWERNKTTNIGLDFAFLNSRVSGTADYYLKRGFDIIVQKPIPLEYGLLNMPINAGDVRNKGYEFTLNVVPVRTKDFNWNINFNTSKTTNNVVRSGAISLTSWQTAVSGGLYKEGVASSGIYSFDFAGLDPATGKPTYNGLNVATNPGAAADVTKALVYSGQLDPKFTGGINNSFRYKAFTLNAMFYISTGNVKRLAPLYENRQVTSAAYSFQNLSSELNNRWRKPGDEAFTNIPSLPSFTSIALGTVSIPGTASAWSPYVLYDYSTARVVNASYARLRNLSMGYLLPAAQAAKFGIRSCQLQASVTNLFYIADKRLNGVDPEVNGNSLPIPRTYSLSLNIGF